MELHSILIIHPSSISTKQQTANRMNDIFQERERKIWSVWYLNTQLGAANHIQQRSTGEINNIFPSINHFGHLKVKCMRNEIFVLIFWCAHFFTLQWIITIQSKLTDTMHSRWNNPSKEQQILIYWTFQLKCSLFSLVNFQND